MVDNVRGRDGPKKMWIGTVRKDLGLLNLIKGHGLDRNGGEIGFMEPTPNS